MRTNVLGRGGVGGRLLGEAQLGDGERHLGVALGLVVHRRQVEALLAERVGCAGGWHAGGGRVRTGTEPNVRPVTRDGLGRKQRFFFVVDCVITER